MRSVIRTRLTYANVISTLALFLALGGGAYAATKLPARSVGSRELKAGAVTRVKIKANAVNGSKVASNSLTGSDIKESSLAGVPNAVHAVSAAGLDKVTFKTAAGAVPAFVGGVGPVATLPVGCDPGQHVISGGVRIDDPANAFVIDEFPDAGGTVWTVRVGNGGPAAVGFTGFAICTTAAIG